MLQPAAEHDRLGIFCMYGGQRCCCPTAWPFQWWGEQFPSPYLSLCLCVPYVTNQSSRPHR